MKHNTVPVWYMNFWDASFLKYRNWVGLSKIHYLSDGCAGQYKNKVQFHQHRVSRHWLWHNMLMALFATSHGSIACDGTGETVKRAMAKEILRRPYTGHIMKGQSMFVFLKEKLETANQFFLWKRKKSEKHLRKADRAFSRCQNNQGNSAVLLIYPSGWRAPYRSRTIMQARQSSWHQTMNIRWRENHEWTGCLHVCQRCDLVDVLVLPTSIGATYPCGCMQIVSANHT